MLVVACMSVGISVALDSVKNVSNMVIHSNAVVLMRVFAISVVLLILLTLVRCYLSEDELPTFTYARKHSHLLLHQSICLLLLLSLLLHFLLLLYPFRLFLSHQLPFLFQSLALSLCLIPLLQHLSSRSYSSYIQSLLLLLTMST